MKLQPAKLGYGEIHYGAEPSKILPTSINEYWASLDKDNPYVQQMKIFLEKGLGAYSMFFAKPGVNRLSAINHLLSIKNSFNIPKEIKLQALTYLSSIWFRFIKIDVSVGEHFGDN